MHAPLTMPIVAKLLGDLHLAFPAGLRGMQDPGRTADLYFRGLNTLPADAVSWAVQKVIEEDNFFPKIARLRELAHSWTKRNSMSFGRTSDASDPDVCQVCGARAQTILITRYRREWVGEPAKLVEVLGEDGRPILETVESQGLHMIHDRYRHGLHLSAEQQEGAA